MPGNIYYVEGKPHFRGRPASELEISMYGDKGEFAQQAAKEKAAQEAAMMAEAQRQAEIKRQQEAAIAAEAAKRAQAAQAKPKDSLGMYLDDYAARAGAMQNAGATVGGQIKKAFGLGGL